MAIQERKQREKEQFKAQVLEAAYAIIRKGGLEALSLRKLASALEYSTTKLYHEFGEKEQILSLLAEDICKRQNIRLEALEKMPTAEEQFLLLTHEAICFYVQEPSSAEVLRAVRFSDMAQPIAFQLAARRYRAHLEALNLPKLATEQALDEAIMLTRALTLGALSILHHGSDENKKKLSTKIVDDGIRLFIAGWKS